MYHQVEIEELKDYSFESPICSSSGVKKRLVLEVVPFTKSLIFKLYLNKELVNSLDNMEDAIQAYNSI